MTQSTLSFRAQGPELVLTVEFDDQQVFHGQLTDQAQPVTVTWDDSQTNNHCLKIHMSGKQNHHTQIDSAGNIVQDLLLTIEDLAIDDVSLVSLLPRIAQYQHGTTVESFYGSMGINGTVTLEFQAPFYLWYLENS